MITFIIVSEGGVDSTSGVVEVSGGVEDVKGGSDDAIDDDDDDDDDGAVEGGGGNEGVLDTGVREVTEVKDGKVKAVDVEVNDGLKTVAV